MLVSWRIFTPFPNFSAKAAAWKAEESSAEHRAMRLQVGKWVSYVMEVPQIIQVMDDHDLVLKLEAHNDLDPPSLTPHNIIMDQNLMYCPLESDNDGHVAI